MYIAAYMTKSERSMGELLRQVSKEFGSEDIKTQMRHLGSVFLNHREVSAQEAVYRVLSLPLVMLLILQMMITLMHYQCFFMIVVEDVKVSSFSMDLDVCTKEKLKQSFVFIDLISTKSSAKSTDLR